jgi:hypothetical protein
LQPQLKGYTIRSTLTWDLRCFDSFDDLRQEKVITVWYIFTYKTKGLT